MFETIEKLLILQDRDRKIMRVKGELARIEPERQMLKAKASGTQSALEAAKQNNRQVESDRKKLELDVQAKKQQIEKYALQQFQTKKNEEYRALSHEIDTCKAAIRKIEDEEIELMEKGETTQREIVVAEKAASDAKKVVDGQVSELGMREENLKKELGELETNRSELASAVEETARSRYERLLKSKGENVVVGINHGVCGGCHMKFPTQIVVSCQAQQVLVSCPNCGRILYYTRDMDLAVAK